MSVGTRSTPHPPGTLPTPGSARAADGESGLHVLAGGGELGALMRAMDWSLTPMGPVAQWPQCLKMAVNLMLNSQHPMWIGWGPEMTFLYNDACIQVLSLAKHPWALGRPAEEVWKEIWDVWGPLADKVFQKGEATFVDDVRLFMRRGDYVEETWYSFSYSPIRDESGRVVGLFCPVTDATAKALNTRRLRTLSELAAKALVEKSVSAACASAASTLTKNLDDVPFSILYLLEPDGRRARLEQTTGLAAGLASVTPLTVELAGAGAARSPWPLEDVVATARSRSVSVAGLDVLPPGLARQRVAEAVVLPVTSSGQERPVGVLIAGVNPARKLDAEYRTFYELVAGQVATAIHNARAAEDEKKRADMLAELDRAKTAFFSNVSHELRTPLTLMLGPVEDGLADRDVPLPRVHRERQELVRRNGLRLQKLVNTLLDFARLEAGRSQATFVPTDLGTLTAELASSFDSAMKAVGLELVVHCPRLPEPVYVDPTMWEKVVLNLLSNAFKFTFEGTVHVDLEWLGDAARLKVQDTGAGIPEEELPRVFERFHRVEGARGRSHEGSGIGLALVYELVKLHGGTVDVESVVGKGTTFTVTVPRGSAHLPQERVFAGGASAESLGTGPGAFLAETHQWNAAEPVLPAELHPEAPSALRTGARILVADDNADMRGYLSRLLSRHWRVEAVSDGARALAAARANPPDLILSDVMMPGLDGLALVRALRADERTRTIPVMLLSARAGEEATIEGLKSGADEYLVKPFSANELLARVNAQLTVSQLRQEAVSAEREHAREAHQLLEESRRATRSREETLAVVSHDLRSPLNTISVAADLLYRGLGEDPAQARLHRHSEAIQRAVRRMNRLIADLLDLASIDAGSLSIQPQPHTLEEVFRELRELFELQVAEREQHWSLECEPGLPPLSFDRDRVLQALSNLVSNALKFTPPGGRITVRAEAAPEGVRVSVSDTGMGIPPEALAYVFERYWHSAQKGREGHGLGLSIARGIVAAHGGTLSATSEPGRGSTFFFTLPMEGRPRREPAKVEAPAVAPLQEAVGAGPLEQVFAHGGEMGALMRTIDWSKTALGPVESWPQSLRTALGTCLSSRFPQFIYWGPRWVQLYNDSGRPIMGDKHPHLSFGRPMGEATPEAMPIIGPMFESVARTGRATWSENQRMFLARSGFMEEVYFTFSYAPIRDESGGVAGIHCAVAETTATVVGERRLRLLRELAARVSDAPTVGDVYRLAIEALGSNPLDLPFVLVYATSEDGGHASLVGSTGIPEGTLVDSAPLRLQDSPEEDARTWPLARVAREGQAVEVRGLAQRLTSLPEVLGQGVPTTALVLPVARGRGEPLRAFLVAGVSPLRALDEEYRGFLSLVAGQLGTAIASARARQEAQARAETLAELDRAKTAFFSNVSHELRTPLTLILGPVEDALASPSRTLADAPLELVRRNVLRLYKLVNTLLDFSRLEAGRARATFVPTDLCALTVDVASTFRSAAERAGLELVVECPRVPESGAEPVYVDPELWEKVVLNLLSNAVKYTHQGSIHVGLRWTEARVVLEVRDTGIGIPADELPCVFERFFRASVSQGRSHEGTGIGLALVRELVKLHGGDVSVESTVGQGTCFTVWLPRGSAHLPAEEVDRTPRSHALTGNVTLFAEEALRWSLPASAPLPADGAPADGALEDGLAARPAPEATRILLADDNADLRTYVSGLLGNAFRRVETVTDGQAALEVARRTLPDLILSDVMMPGLDGFGLVKALRADPRTRAIPVILLTARAGDESTVEGLHSGADDYLVKPFSARELLARVRTQLEMARVRREAAREQLAVEALRESVRVRDEFLDLVGHELRTPVSSLSLNVQGLVKNLGGEGREPRPEVMRSKALAAERQVRRLMRLVEELVGVSEVVTGHLTLARRQVDLGALVATVVDGLREEARRVGSPLIVKAEPAVQGWYDPERLRQVLRHLLDNALKFAAGAPVEVRVAREGSHVSISVVDHGAGVPLDARARIFDRFERAVSTSHYGGFGLGLWMARHLVEAHAGTLQVRDTEGGGATFTVVLPTHHPTVQGRDASL
ncbi:ATP-binding protein [Pyxidicoccus xibeiensis]|uniref:ATP-binding protein n=1 Tax=Pyxidicoccus xibeiensis TaxID=2906759 RepID=UPI0020A7B05B|nr:ATP-binding protein [Pyxidicoccus xibeiensis]MCP3136607.1 ATP-binding protein [Pyxidicoccus xibeiensis]